MSNQEQQADPPRREHWEVDTWLVFTFGAGVLGAYRTEDGARIAAKVVSETPPYINTEVKIARVDLNEHIDVSTDIKTYRGFVRGQEMHR